SSRAVSNPTSSSAERSGLRFALAGWFSTRLGVSVLVVAPRPAMATAAGVKIDSASCEPGCTPLAPYAVRKRNELTTDQSGANRFASIGSSERIQERLAFG